jgi:putative ABC transport system permease protein
VARSLLDDLLGKPAVSNLLFVDTEPGTNASVLAAIIDGTHLQNGTYARSFVRLARESDSAQEQFLDISAGYAAVGLVAAIIAVGIVMIDRVRERRRQIASLRALGASAVTVRRSVRIETGLIALAGMLSGVVCGVLLTWRFDRIDAFAAARGIYVPVVPLVAAVAIVLIASTLAATSAARGLARLQPARVLRANE